LRLIFDVLHPAHVHFFRPLAQEVLKDGGEVLFTAREKDVTLDLLRSYGLPYEVLTGIGGGMVGLARELVIRCARLTWRVKRFRPDLLLGIMGPVIAPVSRVTRVPSWVFYDTETAALTNRFVYPICHRLYLPGSYRGTAPERAIRYPGYHELAYLHPSRFTADPAVREEAGLGSKEPFAVVRLVSWEASHDLGDSGFSDPVAFVTWLSSQIRVVISGERGVPEPLQHLALKLAPERMHHLLAAADLYVGEGATMAAEAAVLGTPAIFVHSARLGYMLDLEEEFSLLWNMNGEQQARPAIEACLRDLEVTRKSFERRREAMLAERIDVGQFLIREVHGALKS
tara:strand:+ start:17596 stop:18621 length:1026 start_codon:yes stop_codon:yes gene_type:complete